MAVGGGAGRFRLTRLLWCPAALGFLPHPAFEVVELLLGDGQCFGWKRSLRPVLHAQPCHHPKTVPHRSCCLIESVRLVCLTAHLGRQGEVPLVVEPDGKVSEGFQLRAEPSPRLLLGFIGHDAFLSAWAERDVTLELRLHRSICVPTIQTIPKLTDQATVSKRPDVEVRAGRVVGDKDGLVRCPPRPDPLYSGDEADPASQEKKP